MARLKAAASMRQQHWSQAGHQAAPAPLLKHVPARLPPSQQAINDWLDAQNPTHAAAAAGAAVSSSVSTAAQAAAGSGFVMDANTGRLVPLQASATQVSFLSGGNWHAARVVCLLCHGCSRWLASA